MSASAAFAERTKKGEAQFSALGSTPTLDPAPRFRSRRQQFLYMEYPGAGAEATYYSFTRDRACDADGGWTEDEGGTWPGTPPDVEHFGGSWGTGWTKTTEVETPTFRRTIHEYEPDQLQYVPDSTYARVELIEWLDDEDTTERLKYDTIDDVPAFPDPFEVTVDPDVVSEVDGGVCFSGRVPWDEVSRIQVPNSWLLAADELSLAIQRVRYRLDLPAILLGNFTLEWDEVFIPDDEEEDNATLTSRSFSGTHADSATGLFDMLEQQQNGRVYVDNVRMTSIS